MAVARRPLLRKTLLHVGLAPFLLFALFPFYHMTLTSLKQDRELYDRLGYPALVRLGLVPYHAFRAEVEGLAAAGLVERSMAPDGTTLWVRKSPG